MPLADRPYLLRPPDDAVLWRYIDLPKLVSLLDRSALHFAPVPTLNDPFEGMHTAPTVEEAVEWMAEGIEDETERERVRRMLLHSTVSTLELVRRCVVVSCWHQNDHESAAMWSIYAPEGNGIALRTTAKALLDSIREPNLDILAGEVAYLDYANVLLPPGMAQLASFMLKRKSFEHEREVRLYASVSEFMNANLRPTFDGPVAIPPDQMYPVAESTYVPVDLDVLAPELVIAPTAPKWYVEAVEAVVRRFGQTLPVSQSKLYDKPVY